MNLMSTARSAATGTGRLIRQHKIISGITAAFAAAIIAVSLATTGTAAPGRGTAGSGTAGSGNQGSGPAGSGNQGGGKQAVSAPAAPGFSLAALGQPGQRVSLSRYPGKPVIINFWASWCPPCQQETPLLARWYKQQHGHVVLLGLDENDSAAAALKFARAKGVTYPIGFDPNVTVALDYNVDGLPQTFFLNASHQIVYHVVGAVTTAELAKGVRQMNAA